jgi:hypothetical protein
LLRPTSPESAAALDKYRSTMQYSPNVPFGFMVAVGSDYRLEAHLTSGQVLVGEPLHITARTTEAWWPNADAQVEAIVTTPSGSEYSVDLYDDGLHGDGEAKDATFGLDFTGTSEKGYYEFLIRSHGVTKRKENVVREQELAKYVGKVPPDLTVERECIPCWLLRLIFIVIIGLLLLILIVLLYCCKRQRLMATTVPRDRSPT